LNSPATIVAIDSKHSVETVCSAGRRCPCERDGSVDASTGICTRADPVVLVLATKNTYSNGPFAVLLYPARGGMFAAARKAADAGEAERYLREQSVRGLPGFPEMK